MSNLTWLRKAQIAGKMLSLDIPVSASPEEMSISISRIGKEDCHLLVRGASSNPLRPRMRQKGGRKVNFLPLLELGH